MRITKLVRSRQSQILMTNFHINSIIQACKRWKTSTICICLFCSCVRQKEFRRQVRFVYNCVGEEKGTIKNNKIIRQMQLGNGNSIYGVRNKKEKAALHWHRICDSLGNKLDL